MAKKKTHQRNLERARANRAAQGRRGGGGGGGARRSSGGGGLGLDGRRIGALALVAVMAIGVVVAAISLRDDGDPTVAVEPFDAGDEADPAAEGGDAADADVDDGTDDAAAGASSCSAEGAPEPTSQVYDSAPELTIDTSATYTATIVTTCGTVEAELFADGSPLAVNNFVFLANEGYYAGVPFHRVIDGFMIQGGDPSGTGSGGPEGYPGYTFPDELDFTEQYVEENGGYVEGTLAMANAGPDTNGSQFFIMDGVTPLPPQYVVFGRLTSGQDVVDAISQVPVGGPRGDQALDPVRIVSVEVEQS